MIISAFDEEAILAEKLDNCLALERGGHDIEFVVVADGSSDATAEIARSYERHGVRVLHDPERRGKSAAINRGAAAARGDVLLLSDANNMWSADALLHLIAAFDDPLVGGVTGTKTVTRNGAGHAESEGLYWRYEHWIRAMEHQLGACTAANGEIMAVRASCFAPIPEHVVVDDLHVAISVLRSGHRFVLAEKAISSESPAFDESAERERRARIAAGRFELLCTPGAMAHLSPRVCWQLLSHKAGRLAVPAGMVGLATSSAVLALIPANGRFGGVLRTLARAAAAAQLTVYLAAGTAPRLPSRTPRHVRRLAEVARYVVVSNLAIADGIVRAVRGRQPAVWQPVARAVSS